eukprot:scaffold42443_cov33-Tisochrysis_lutea.AAC.5
MSAGATAQEIGRTQAARQAGWPRSREDTRHTPLAHTPPPGAGVFAGPLLREPEPQYRHSSLAVPATPQRVPFRTPYARQCPRRGLSN